MLAEKSSANRFKFRLWWIQPGCHFSIRSPCRSSESRPGRKATTFFEHLQLPVIENQWPARRHVRAFASHADWNENSLLNQVATILVKELLELPLG